MASEDRTSAPAVGGADDVLLREGSSYAFFQAMRLLRLRFGSDEALRQGVRVRPHLSLGFPETDIESIEIDEAGRYRIEANFFGLYGVTSPLPTFYTEDLIDEAMDSRTVTRDFLDILHAHLYPVLFRAWEKYRIWLAVSEHQSTERLEQLYALIGLRGAGNVLGLGRALLPYAGLFSWRPRSALGLQALLAGLFDTDQVSVVTGVRRFVAIPQPDRCRLGLQAARLGDSAVLGSQVADEAGNLDIRFGPLERQTFRRLLPGADGFDLLARVVGQYLEAPLRCEATLTLHADEVEGVRLGVGWNRLGLETWLGDAGGASGPGAGMRPDWPAPIRFPIPTISARCGTSAMPAHAARNCPMGPMDMEMTHHDAG